MTISKFRSILYAIAKLLGDFSALKSGNSKKIGKRAGRRIFGKVSGRLMGKLFR